MSRRGLGSVAWTVAVLALASAGLAAAAPPPGPAQRAVEPEADALGSKPVPGLHGTLDSLLADCVKDGVVSYPRVCARWRLRLDRYLDRLARIDDTKLAANERRAFLFDLYDATMIAAVCERGRPGWTPAADGFAVFKAPLVRMRGGALSLDSLEHGIIRPFVRDPRVHVALVCGARSCPPLPSRAWHAADLDSMLDARMRRFVRDTTRNRVDAPTRALHLSPIFHWYSGDFGGEAAVPAYVGRWLARDVTGWSILWMDYDWSLNGPSPR